MDKLLIYTGTRFDREVPLADVTSIGRLAKNTIQLEAAEISRVHAIITRTATGFVVTDQGSMNGTSVNGRKLAPKKPAEITDGDRIRLESFELRVSLAKHASNFDAARVSESSIRLERVLSAPPTHRQPLADLAQSGHADADGPIWNSGTTRLVVADIIDEAPGVRTFRFVGKRTKLFTYEPGQFVTLALDIDLETVYRSFSLSSTPSRPHTLELTVRRSDDDNGASAWMHDSMRLGDEVSMHGPSGHFSCTPFRSRKLLFITGGIGITPVMSMLRWIADTAADVDVVVVHSVGAPAEIVFRSELEFLAARHPGIRIHTTVTSNWDGAQPWAGRTGHVDRAMISDAAPDLAERHVYLCAPAPMREAVVLALRSLSFPLANLWTESFRDDRIAVGTVVEPPGEPETPFAPPTSSLTDSSAGEPPRAPVTAPGQAPARYTVRFTKSGVEARATADMTLLEIAEANGVEIPYGCRAGECGTCAARCSGTNIPTHAADTTFTCVTRPASDVVVDA